MSSPYETIRKLFDEIRRLREELKSCPCYDGEGNCHQSCFGNIMTEEGECLNYNCNCQSIPCIYDKCDCKDDEICRQGKCECICYACQECKE
jgi:hypothetical protein